MNTLMNMDFLRIIRFIAGAGFIIYGLLIHHYLLAFMGGFLFLQAVLNIGCCAAGGCGVPVSKNDNQKKEIDYEEIS